MTAGALVRHGVVERVDCVDLSPAVFAAARFFAGVNGRVTEDPKARPRVEDGRQHLLLAPEPYDVVTLEPPPPRYSGVANLYSRDFYRLVRDRLGPGGIAAQWIPMHSHTEEEMRMLVRSFVEVFPGSTLWVPAKADAILIGSAGRPGVDAARIRERMAAPAVAEDLADVDVREHEALLGAWFADAPRLAAYVRDAEPITDDRPAIEFFAGRDLVERPVHLEWLLPFWMPLAEMMAAIGAGPEGGPPAARDVLARHHAAMGHFYVGAVLLDRGDREGSASEWRRALSLDPGSAFFRRLNGLPPAGS
jgi:spermidine synthase